MITIPTYSDPFYTQQILLDGVNYNFEWRWSARENTWRFSITDVDGTILVQGVKVVCNVDLLRKFSDPRKPAGALVAYSNTSDRSPPGLNDFSETGRVTLTYLEASDLVSQ